MKLRKEFKDPMVIVLCCLLCFLTLGSLISGKKSKAKYIIGIDVKDSGYEGLVNEVDVIKEISSRLVDKLNDNELYDVVVNEGSINNRVDGYDECNVVLSLMADGSASEETSGTYIYVNDNNSDYHDESVKFGKAIQKNFDGSLVKYLYYNEVSNDTYAYKIVDIDNSEDLDTFAIMERVDKPVVVFNAFYVTNSDEVNKYANSDGYELIATNLYNSICDNYR